MGQAVLDGSLAPVPILSGYNGDEGTLLYPSIRSPTIWALGDGLEEGSVHDRLRPHFGDDTDPLVALYGLDDPTEAEAHAVDMLGDDLFGAQHRFLARQHAQRDLPVYLYHFTREPPSRRQTLGAYHAADLTFVFDSHDGFFFVTDRGDRHLTEEMLGYWTRFAATGDPNGDGALAWPRYDPEADAWMILDRTLSVEAGVRARRLAPLEAALLRKLEDSRALRSSAP